MFKKINWPLTIITGSLAGVLFSIPIFFFIYDATYTESWLFYVGSAFFAIIIAVYTGINNKIQKGNITTTTSIFMSLITTGVGIIVSCILCFILLVIFVPGYLNNGNTPKDIFPNTIYGKTGELSFDVFTGAIMLNFSAGAFASFMYSFTVKKYKI